MSSFTEFFPTTTVLQAPSLGMPTAGGACSGPSTPRSFRLLIKTGKKHTWNCKSIQTISGDLLMNSENCPSQMIVILLHLSTDPIALEEVKNKKVFVLCSIVSNCYSCHCNILQLQVEEEIAPL